MERIKSQKCEQLSIFLFVLKLGIILYPLFYLLDWIYFPESRAQTLAVRLCVTLYLVFVYLLARKVEERFHFFLILSAFEAAALGISLICYLTGEGFASPHYTGLLQVILFTTPFHNISPRRYILTIGLIVIQHFVIQMALPWTFKYFITNLLAIGIIAVAAVFLHNFIHGLVRENRTLRGLLPICSNCKKIRDEKGSWHHVEAYITHRSEVEFTHGICPECAKQLYPQYVPGA